MKVPRRQMASINPLGAFTPFRLTPVRGSAKIDTNPWLWIMLVCRAALRLAVKLKPTAEVAPTTAQAGHTLCVDNGAAGLAFLGDLDRWCRDRRWFLVDRAVTVASLATRATVYSLVLNLNEKVFRDRASGLRLTMSIYRGVGLQGSWGLDSERAKN